MVISSRKPKIHQPRSEVDIAVDNLLATIPRGSKVYKFFYTDRRSREEKESDCPPIWDVLKEVRTSQRYKETEAAFEEISV